VEEALASHDYFDLICLDIRMPRMDGQEALKGIRQLEERAGIQLGDGAKIIMTTAFGDTRNIFTAFRENAEGYLTKPVTRDALLTQLGKLGLNERAP
jgi:two-component system chemotaxis response regulator CheY